MASPRWQRLEREIAILLAGMGYHDVRKQLPLPARRSRREARRAFPGRRYVAAPRFDVVARRPLTFRARYFECKRYATPVTQDLVAGFAYRLWLCAIPYRQGVIVASPELTPAAERLATRCGIAVWDGRPLERRLILAAALSPSPLGGARAAYRTARYALSIFTS